jgi:hypothetical protein
VPPARFNNTLSERSLERIRRLVLAAETLSEPRKTAALIEEADAAQDPKGALGALRMLDVEGVVHATAGGRKQLIWNAGPRPEGVSAPRAAWLGPTKNLHKLLRSASNEWLPTDYLVLRCGFDPDLSLGQDEMYRTLPALRGMPVTAFSDVSKNGRRYALGALKALHVRETVEWGHYSSQAIVWRWVGPGALGHRRESWPMLHFEYHREPDSILNPRGYEWHRARQGGVDKRKLAHTRAWQAWIEENHPAEATAYELRKYQKERELKRQSEQDQKEARSWGWKPDE